MKLFYFTLEVRDGEHEYLSYHVVWARTDDSATRKARDYARRFLGVKMKWRNQFTLEPEGSDEYRYVKFNGVSETTVEQMIQRLLI